MDIRRFFQVSHYAWIQSQDISKTEGKGFGYRLSIYIDMIFCFLKYRMWTNLYIKESFWTKNKEERELLGAKCKEEGIKRDAWQKDFRENRKFLIKYANIKYEKASLREKRNKAYTKKFHAGKNLFVEYDVNISRQHYLEGTISIGDNVLLAKHSFIDYSGELIIHDNVSIANDVIIETHTHTHTVSRKGSVPPTPSKLEIFDGVAILSRAFIADTCHSIGRNASIGAGSYVRNNIPPYAIVIGNPAKIVGFKMTPEEIVEYEKKNYEETNRLPLDLLEKNYEKYFRSRWKEIKQWSKL